MVELTNPIGDRITASAGQIAEFCQRWKIIEFAFFGSVLRDDFRPDSDIDVLVTFSPDSSWSLFDWVDMKDELEALFGRKVDIADKEGLKNPYRRQEILRTQQVIYANKQP
ncbi:nucleotidyltransferase family protein [Leptolyngbya sp. NK1-12]|uniref:Nucleotidyltransferase family protein n=2 Tax=Leptolyngbya sp. NK1-12 TaxID=2547451 RepID=A0AA97AN94_9CYAN|nr:nucleotidyltransferase family protein [Leptolyngbya sp. NK1-12]